MSTDYKKHKINVIRLRTEKKSHHRSALVSRFVTFGFSLSEDLSAAGAGTDSMTKSLGHCKEGDGKASILTQLQHNKQTPAENYAEFALLYWRSKYSKTGGAVCHTGCHRLMLC